MGRGSTGQPGRLLSLFVVVVVVFVVVAVVVNVKNKNLKAGGKKMFIQSQVGTIKTTKN